MRAVVIAGPHSGAGKTTLSLALMAAARRRGLTVQAFKVGPDFIDPGHHALATSRPSHNLDGWMLSREENLAIFQRQAADADLAVVEGVMGLYDGFHAQEETGSTAQMAKWLGAPVLLAVGARAMARSLAALARGFYAFDPGLSWVGLVANQVGSDNHREILRSAMELCPELPFLGGLKRNPSLALGERHLGLVTAEDGGYGEAGFRALADWLEEGLPWERLWDALPSYPLAAAPADATPVPAPSGRPVRLGVARDRAFCFYYQENLRRLAEAGAELVFFSPLTDPALPPDLDGLYFGGGYPELFAAELAANESLRREVTALGRSGRPVYAECGGMMYLGQGLSDLEGRSWPMTGLLDLETRMLRRLKSLGYREVSFLADTPLGPAGGTARGHEFHYSEIADPAAALAGAQQVYQARGRRGAEPETLGFRKGNLLASYVHLHFGSNPRLAHELVDRCRLHKD
ncbi:MAG: cobyrinate a,c-diamide synthase [Deltaproteobacteria bacterium]|nr:cobyrinate a,c-diamide synthase [Deltaproteobacteria bacterium]